MSTHKKGDKWRYRCPNGHTQWRVRCDRYYCRQCAVNGNDPHFEELQDMKAEPLRY